MTNDEILRADENDRLDWIADGAARAAAGEPRTSPVLGANERAYADYLADHPHYIPSQREIFDCGWDAAIEYADRVHLAELHQLTLLVRQQSSLIEALESAYRGR